MTFPYTAEMIVNQTIRLNSPLHKAMCAFDVAIMRFPADEQDHIHDRCTGSADEQANELEAQGLRGTRAWHAWVEAAAKYWDEAHGS